EVPSGAGRAGGRVLPVARAAARTGSRGQGSVREAAGPAAGHGALPGLRAALSAPRRVAGCQRPPVLQPRAPRGGRRL
ncbi:MAG: hypothetical protein AVDCRST_MAG51-1196, partial [uncultured Ramlibacter sp.]